MAQGKKNCKKEKLKKAEMVKNSYFGILIIVGDLFMTNYYYGLDEQNKKLVFLFLVFALLYFFLCKLNIWRRKARYLNSALSKLDHLEGEEFEKYCKALFETKGYRVKLTPQSHDFGADLVMRKNGKTTVVQAKRYKNTVGIAAVQQVIGSKEYYHADDCAVITNNYFTDAAKELAKANNVTLYDRNYLLKVKRTV